MCARFTMRLGAQVIQDLFDVDEIPEMPERFNVAPTQDVPAITQSREGDRKMRMLRWGLVPHWAKNLAIGNQLINARSESLDSKPAFRSAFERRRCLIPSEGFFEWKDVPLAEQGSLFDEKPKAAGKPKKQPYYITLKDGAPFAFAGLWERWSDEEGRIVDSCTIVTTRANDVVAKLHDRMPVILHHEDYAQWLDRHEQDTSKLKRLLVPYPSGEMKAVPVSPIVSNPRNDTPECIQPLHAA